MPPLEQNAESVGHLQVPFTQFVPPLQTLPQAPQFWLVFGGPQVPAEQQVPCEQHVTLSESSEGQRFCVFPPHCLQALLQLARCGRGRVLQ